MGNWKWHFRQAAILYATYFASTTVIFVIVPLLASFYSVIHGSHAIAQIAHTKAFPIEVLFNAFWEQEIWPSLTRAPITLLIDVVIRRFVLHLNE